MKIDAKPKLKKGVVVRVDGQQLVLFDPSIDNILELNEIGSRIIEFCDGTVSVKEIIDALNKQFPHNEDQISSEVHKFFNKLDSMGVLIS